MPEKDKRLWPLELIKVRRKLLESIHSYIKESIVNDTYFSFKPDDDHLPYFFLVKEYDPKPEKPLYRAIYMPKSPTDPTEGTGGMLDVQLLTHFNEWQNLVKEYVYELSFEQKKDTIIQGYEGEFLEFVILDDDADIHSYPTGVQLLIDKQCSDAIESLNAFVSNNSLSADKKIEIVSIIESIQDLQETQTELSKQAVAQKIANIWARIKKLGIRLFNEVKADLFKSIFKIDNKKSLGDSDSKDNNAT